MISSTKNPKIQWVRRLQQSSAARKAENAFVIEGVRLIEEGLNSGWEIQYIFHSDDLSERGKKLLRESIKGGIQVEIVTDNVLKAISLTKTPQGILAVLKMRTISIPEQLDFVLILDQIREPGNLGTILRSASAAGIQAVFLTRGTVDPFSPKVLRAAMGAHFCLPVCSARWAEIKSYFEQYSLHPYLATVGAGDIYYQANFQRPLALILGGEAEGASDAARDIAGTNVHIPMYGGGESLNVSVAAGILLFEIARQREKNQ